jgi:amino acid transporter
MPRATVISCALTTSLYLLVSFALSLLATPDQVDTEHPLDASFVRLGYDWLAVLVSVGAFAGITATLLVSLVTTARLW